MTDDLCRITSVNISVECGMMVNVGFEGEGWGQGTGFYGCGKCDGTQPDFLGWFLKTLIEACGKESLDQVPGTLVRIVRKGGEYHASVAGFDPVRLPGGAPKAWRIPSPKEAKEESR